MSKEKRRKKKKKKEKWSKNVINSLKVNTNMKLFYDENKKY